VSWQTDRISSHPVLTVLRATQLLQCCISKRGPSLWRAVTAEILEAYPTLLDHHLAPRASRVRQPVTIFSVVVEPKGSASLIT
jgi:hypothetical protein